MCKFKSGDKVKLASDIEANTPMTVDCYSSEDSSLSEAKLFCEEFDNNLVKCVWRDKQDIPHTEYYNESALILVE